MKYKHVLGLVFLIVLIDQIIKIYVKLNFEYGESINVLGLKWFQLYFIENSGMAFGMKIMDSTMGKTILTLFRLVAVTFGFFWVKNIINKGMLDNGAKICIAMVLAGAAGNLIDSMFYGVLFDKGLAYDAVRGGYSVAEYHGLAQFAPGNGYAPLLHGSVVDMFHFPMIDTHWPKWMPFVGGDRFTFFDPIFNFADFSISTMQHQFEANLDFAQSLDDSDILHSFRERFFFPQIEGQDALYFCGNSLGLQPRSAAWLFQRELDDWATHGVEGHVRARNPWKYYQNQFSESLAKIVGANPSEVVAMNTLTVNLHLLLISFYRPTKERYKIIMEAGAFPSDQYAIETQVKMHGFDPADAIIEITPKADEHTLNDEDILNIIRSEGDKVACVMMGGVNYYTGQLYDMKAITEVAHEVGAICGFDLAHAMGNVPMQLHDWNVDFACWCSYKYLNSGPGGVGGVFIHEKHGNNPDTPRLAGWWGNDVKTRFDMKKGFVPVQGAASWQMSNAPVFNMVVHKASLDIFDKLTVEKLREKSLLLTAYLEFLLGQVQHLNFEIITPKEQHRRGAQLSMLFAEKGKEVFEYLEQNGVMADWREPNVIRVAPVPMYNSFEDVYKLYETLQSFK